MLYTAEVLLLAAFVCSRNTSLCVLEIILEILFSGENVPYLFHIRFRHSGIYRKFLDTQDHGYSLSQFPFVKWCRQR